MTLRFTFKGKKKKKIKCTNLNLQLIDGHKKAPSHFASPTFSFCPFRFLSPSVSILPHFRFRSLVFFLFIYFHRRVPTSSLPGSWGSQRERGVNESLWVLVPRHIYDPHTSIESVQIIIMWRGIKTHSDSLNKWTYSLWSTLLPSAVSVFILCHLSPFSLIFSFLFNGYYEFYVAETEWTIVCRAETLLAGL